MRFLTITATALTISAGVSFAQATQNSPENSSGQEQGMSEGQTESFPSIQPPPPPSLDNQQQGDGAGISSNGSSRHEMRFPRNERRASDAAQIMVDTGAARIRVRCGGDQSSNDCVDMVVELLDRVQRNYSQGDGHSWRDQDRYRHRDSRWERRNRDR